MSAPISLSEIAFHIPSDDQTFHRQSVADLLHRNTLGFPGAQPVSFARHHLDELQHTDYFMCEKTDGIRCLLFSTQIPDGSGGMMEAQFLIDRRNEYYYITRESLHIPVPADFAGYHVGTLLDGELVRQSQTQKHPARLAYLIFDCLAIDNEDVTNRPFDKRLARIDALVKQPLRDFQKRYPQDVAAQPFQIEMKEMQRPYGMEMMFRDIFPKLPHGNDGLIFTCKNTSYVAGTDQHILKWKPPQENTIDFRLILGDFPMLEDEDGTYEDWDACPDTELWVNHGGRESYKYFASLTLADTEWDALKRLNQPLDGRIIECYRDPAISTGDVWRPKLDGDTPRFRDDKQDANHISVVESVLGSIKDAVTEQDLMDAAPAIRHGFKAREKAEQEERKRLEGIEREKRKRAEEMKRRESVVDGDDDGPRYED